jgi:hypothetical protein
MSGWSTLMALRTHRGGDAGKTRVLEFCSDEPVRVDVDLVLLLRTPLAVIEHHRNGGNVLAHAGQHFAKAHAQAPSPT